MKQKQPLNQRQLKNVIRSGVALIDFNAPWCAPCRVQKPILDQLANQYHGIVSIMELNVDEHQESAMAFGITSIPTLIIFKDGKEIQRFVGLQSQDTLSKAIEDMLE
ncbi:MAG: thioredoxin [Desulfobulbaceae bacterium]|nr:thioredoxin [Desulfobulbaceae bacterium]